MARVDLHIPGARTLKDGRNVLRSARDRVRARFEVAIAEIDAGRADRRTIVVSAIGNDPKELRSLLDRLTSYLNTSIDAVVVGVQTDVFRWEAPL